MTHGDNTLKLSHTDVYSAHKLSLTDIDTDMGEALTTDTTVHAVHTQKERQNLNM